MLAAMLGGALLLAALALMPEPVPVDVALVTRGALVVAIRETGKTRVKDRFVVSAPVSGMLERGVKSPSFDAIAKLAGTLGVPADALFVGTDTVESESALRRVMIAVRQLEEKGRIDLTATVADLLEAMVREK